MLEEQPNTLGTSSSGCGSFVKLAFRVLSIVPNSASTESAFSVFGNTHTKLRNRIGASKVHRSTLIRMDLNRQHEQARPVRKKRNFGTLIEDELGAGDHTTGHLPIQDVPQAARIPAEDTSGPPSFADVASDLINHSTIIDSEGAENPQEDFQTPETAADEEHPVYSRIYIPIPLKKVFDYSLTSETHKGLKFHWNIGENLLRVEEDMLSTTTTTSLVP